MTNVKPATDEQVARFKVRAVIGALWSDEALSLIARIDADREEIAYLKTRSERDMCADGHERIRYTPDEDFGPCPVCVLRAEISKDGEVAALNAAWSRDMGINPPVTSAEARQIVATSNRERAQEIAALKAEVERLTPAFLPCHVCGGKGISDIIHGAVVRCENCDGTGRAR